MLHLIVSEMTIILSMKYKKKGFQRPSLQDRPWNHGLKPWLLYQIIRYLTMRIKIFLVESNEDPICPVCGSPLKYRDHIPRIVKTRSGDVSWIHIRRLKCTNDKCRKLHRELPDKLAPYKHYETDVISGVLEGSITPDTKGYEDYPCEATMQSWHHWLNANRLMIDGTLKSAGYRFLGFTEELLTASVSLLDQLKSDTADWLKIILRFIYNSGNFLKPAWDC